MRNKQLARLKAEGVVKDLADRYPVVGAVSVEMHDLGDTQFAMAADGKIVLNDKQWQPKLLQQREQAWRGLMVDSSADGTLLHEFGHVLMSALRRKHGPTVDAVVERYASDRPVSPYAMDNRRQFEAESFVAYHTGTVTGVGPAAASALASASAMWEELLAL